MIFFNKATNVKKVASLSQVCRRFVPGLLSGANFSFHYKNHELQTFP